uniref:Uncharacterized protein n=1 Tax=Rhodnius prolixus TaxID=13249 RepID=T1HG03_RHOPR
MECITISSDDDEIQVLTVKLVQTPVKVKSNNSPSSSFEDEEEGSKSSVQWIKVEKSQLNDSSTDKNKFLSNNNLVPVITLEDDGDESDFENKSSAQTKCKTALPLQKIERLRSNCDSEKAPIPQKFRNGEIKSQVGYICFYNQGNFEIHVGVTNIEKDSENLNEQEDGNLSNKPLVKK